jgi:iron complex transport system substrate-binding protein
MKKDYPMNKSLFLIVILLTLLPISTAQEETACEEGFRLVEHNLGEICIPEDPQRIAAIDLDVIALMRLLDIKPVAHVGEFYENWLASTQEWTGGEAFIEGSIDVGYPVNVEAVLEAQPDLIITNDPENYDQLNAIAPTVLFDIYATDSESWTDFSRYIGDILNASDEVEAIIEQTDARIAALGEYAQTEADNPVTSVVLYSEYGILSGAPYFVYNQVMAQADIARPEFQTISSEEFDEANEIYWAFLNEEQLPLIDGDILVMMVSQTPEEIAYADALLDDIGSDPLWGFLTAVRNDEVYSVPYQRWISFDPYSVNALIDDLFQIIAGSNELAPNPFHE